MQSDAKRWSRGALLLLLVHASVALAAPLAEVAQLPLVATGDSLKVPGFNNAYHCSDPADDLFQISDLTFNPVHPQVGLYQYIKFWGHFAAETGPQPWLNVTGTIDGKATPEPMYDAPLCDIDIFQEMPMPRPGHHDVIDSSLHRACPPGIKPGYTQIDSPAMPLYPNFNLEGKWDVHAEATTEDGRRIFCIEGTVVVQNERQRSGPSDLR